MEFVFVALLAEEQLAFERAAEVRAVQHARAGAKAAVLLTQGTKVAPELQALARQLLQDRDPAQVVAALLANAATGVCEPFEGSAVGGCAGSSGEEVFVHLAELASSGAPFYSSPELVSSSATGCGRRSGVCCSPRAHQPIEHKTSIKS